MSGSPFSLQVSFTTVKCRATRLCRSIFCRNIQRYWILRRLCRSISCSAPVSFSHAKPVAVLFFMGKAVNYAGGTAAYSVLLYLSQRKAGDSLTPITANQTREVSDGRGG